MVKYYGKIGFGHNEQTSPGIYEDVITEVDYKGDVTRPSVKAQGEKILSDFSIGNEFSIIADAYLSDNAYAIRYITWLGVRWTVKKINIDYPRLRITVGEVYNGPTA